MEVGDLLESSIKELILGQFLKKYSMTSIIVKRSKIGAANGIYGIEMAIKRQTFLDCQKIPRSKIDAAETGDKRATRSTDKSD
jgi:hypothetical protein